jgi:hypothetical protein
LVIGSWAFIGSISLLVMAVMDFKNNMQVDDRGNYLMLGCSIMLLSFLPRSIWYILILAFGIGIVTLGMKRLNAFGEADLSAIRWIMLGFGYISPFHSLMFFLAFSGLMLVQLGVKKYMLHIDRPTPLFGVILGAFIINCVAFGYYLS